MHRHVRWTQRAKDIAAVISTLAAAYIVYVTLWIVTG